jgi:signal recognition particle receptor subunit beta
VSSVNLLTREIALKVVYYGPGLGGKTSTLQYIHRALKSDSRGQLVSLATGVDRTLYFDFLPIKLPKLRGYTVRVQLYTVPGQVHYNSTRKLVLTGADGVVFVADSQVDRFSANLESLENMYENLREQGLGPTSIPLVIQYNKRDAPTVTPVAELEAKLNPGKVPAFETVATKGTGVFEALKAITSAVLADLRKKGNVKDVTSESTAAPEAPRRPAPADAERPSEPKADSGMTTLGSLSEVADAIERLAPNDGRTTTSGLHRLPSTNVARTFSDLLPASRARDGLSLVETDVERGDWAAAVRRAGAAYADLAGRVAGALAQGGEELVMAALVAGVPASRLQRFREALGRVEAGGAVTSFDALFALFFLADFSLRAEELKK